MARKKQVHACPVCSRELPNAGALAAHARLSKDSAHVAYRSKPESVQAEAPAATPAVPVEPAPAPVPEPVPEPVVVVKQEKSAALEAQAQQEKTPEPAAVVVRFAAPQVVAPLAGDQKQEAAASPTGEAKPAMPTVSEMPLEPFIAASVTSIVNAFAIDPAKGDRLLTNQEVGKTGFPKALEASVRKYYPDLPLDHPLLLLGISGTALVAEVKAHRAPRDGAPLAAPPAREAAASEESVPVQGAAPEPVAPPSGQFESPEQKALAAMMGGA